MVYAITDISESNTIPGCFDNKKVSVITMNLYTKIENDKSNKRVFE